MLRSGDSYVSIIEDMKMDTLTSTFLDLRGKLHNIAMRFLRSDDDAKDALQDAYLRLRMNGDIESSSEAGNKLVAVLRNVCVDRLRASHTVVMDETETYESFQCETDIEDMANLERLLQTGLTPLQKRIYNMITHQGLEYEEIAKILDMTVEAVRMNMSRTRSKIRKNYNALNR